jgi:hypothetical protein
MMGASNQQFPEGTFRHEISAYETYTYFHMSIPDVPKLEILHMPQSIL